MGRGKYVVAICVYSEQSAKQLKSEIAPFGLHAHRRVLLLIKVVISIHVSSDIS